MNFDYIKNNNDFKKLYDLCNNSEHLVYNMPNLSVTSARKAIEFICKFIYTTYLETEVKDMTLLDMLNHDEFKNLLHQSIK